MDSVGARARGDVIQMTWVVRGRGAVAVASELCAEASEHIDQAVRIVDTARLTRRRSAAERVDGRAAASSR